MRAALAMNSAGTLHETLEVITEQARFVVGAHQSISSFTIDQQWAQAVTAISLSDKYAAYRSYDEKPDGTGIYRLVCEQNRPFRMTQEELVAHPAFHHFSWAAGRHPPIRGWLAAPLVDRHGKNLGLIQLSDKYEGEFNEEDEAILVQLAQMASVATENARLRDERTELLARERAARAEMEEALKARDVFVSVASHELRTPLTTLRLQLDGLSRMASKIIDETLRKQLLSRVVVLRRQHERLEALIGQLLDISRITTGRLDFNLEPVDLSQVVLDVVTRFSEVAEIAKCPLEVDLPEELIGEWDRMRLDQIVTNLLSNALKYGAGKPVEIRAGSHEGRAFLRVVDHGIGIAEAEQSRLFRRFERLVSDRHYGGLGLGLWIVRQIVERLGGTIRVESKLGEGSTFIVDLPLIQPHPRSSPSPSP